MADAPWVPPVRPPLTWRVGVTGHRTLPEAGLPALRGAVAEVLGRVRATVQAAAARPEVRAAYDLDATGPTLRLLSPLADGADRLVAEAAVALGYRLDVVLPFAQPDYERTLDAATASAFRALLAEAGATGGASRVITLDGAFDGLRGESYRTVGRFVVRNCDLLIAVWDGGRPAGRGGTAEVVQAALAAGLPVWWIDPARPEAPRLLDPAAPAGEPAEAALAEGIRRAIEPLACARPAPHGALGALAQRLNRALGLSGTPTEDFLREAAPRPPRLRGLYARFLDLVAPPPPQAAPPTLPPPEGPVEAWWERHHATAARLSAVYADRYRSSYVMVFLLAGLALMGAAFALAVPHSAHLPFLVVELAALLGIALLVAANQLHRWQDRWIAYRLLAELCRKQRILAPLGWTLPVRDIARALVAGAGGAAADPPPREAWVGWYFAAIRRAAPAPTGALAGPALARARDVGRAMFEDQRAYHRRRGHRSERAAERLGRWGEAFFLVAVLGVTIRIALDLAHAPPWTGTAVALLCFASPAASAVFIGIRAYAEFELLAKQSARMQQIMADAIPELDALTLDQPLASNALGQSLVTVTTAMLLDIEGWAQLFQVKAVEAG